MNDAVPVCPNCGSTDLGHDSLSVISRLSLSGARECRDCGYSGIFPEADREEIDGFDGVDGEPVRGGTGTEKGFRTARFGLGAVLFLLGLGATTSASWGNGLLAGMLALAVGAAVMAEELSNRFRLAQ